jgi:hypothetical protein
LSNHPPSTYVEFTSGSGIGRARLVTATSVTIRTVRDFLSRYRELVRRNGTHSFASMIAYRAGP